MLGLLPLLTSPTQTHFVPTVKPEELSTDSDSKFFEFNYPYPTPPPFQLATLLPTIMPPTTKIMAEVKITKIKDCLMLTDGTITPILHQAWSLTCKHYLKHGGKTAARVVSFIAEGMMQLCLIHWYPAGQARIDALTLQEYLDELAELTLDCNWAYNLQEQILTSEQGDHPFIDWKIEMENLNSILTISTPDKVLSSSALKDQLQAKLHPDLQLSLTNKPITATELTTWSIEVKGHNDHLKFEEMHTQHIFEHNTTSMAAARFAKKSLISRLSDPPSSNSSHNATASGSNTITQSKSLPNLPKLTADEHTLLTDHEGCFHCCLFYAGHCSAQCPMIVSNSWPNPATYQMLMLAMAHAAAPASSSAITTGAAFVMEAEEDHDYDTSDTYVPTPILFTVPHLYASFEITGPLIEEFPVPVKALLDIGCPSTVISHALATKLSLQHFPLPLEEDNLSSLSELPLHCSKYMKLEVSSTVPFQPIVHTL